MKYNSDIKHLISSMNVKQRKRFYKFIEKVKKEGLDEKLDGLSCMMF